MKQEQPKSDVKNSHEHENREAERFAQELEAPLGAQKLGDEAYELVKKELAKRGVRP
jgi:hypothetical protein